MADMTDADIESALRRGEEISAASPKALNARYDPRRDRIVIELTNGCTFAFPPRLVQGLEDASPAHLAEVEILGAGTGLHWESLDVDFSVQGLLAGVFGTKSYLARRAGQATSPAKAAAARANGSKGGRPPKTSTK